MLDLSSVTASAFIGFEG